MVSNISDLKSQCGILYVASGSQYIEEALYSATRLKQVMPEARIALICDTQVPRGPFDECLIRERQGDIWIWRIQVLKETPFQRTVFMDTDCYACRPFPELFESLDNYDICAVWENSLVYQKTGHPQYLQTFNCGLLVYEKSGEVLHFFDEWMNTYKMYNGNYEKGHPLRTDDQPAFLAALHQSGLRMLPLPNCYNFRALKAGILSGPLKILHCRPDERRDYENIERLINGYERWPKVFIGWNVYCRNGKDGQLRVGNVLTAALSNRLLWFVKLKQRLKLSLIVSSVRRMVKGFC